MLNLFSLQCGIALLVSSLLSCHVVFAEEGTRLSIQVMNTESERPVSYSHATNRVDQLHHWAKTVGIQGLGPATVEAWVEADLVTTYADLYRLTPGAVAELPLMMRTRSLAAIRQLQAQRWVGWAVALEALGLPNVGQTQAERLSEVFPTANSLKSATLDKLITVEGIGETTAQGILDIFRTPEMAQELEDLMALGVIERGVTQEELDALPPPPKPPIGSDPPR